MRVAPVRRVIVTGAAGCVGRAVAERLSSEGIAVLGVGRSEPRQRGLLRVAEWHTRDLLDSGVEDLLEDCDGFVHLAALVHEPDNEDWTAYKVTNVDLTRRLLRMWVGAGRPAKRFLLASTVAVYGPAADLRADETTNCDPQTPYARSKLEAERLVLEAGGTVVRLPVVYGPGDRGNVRLLIDTIARGRFVLPSNCTAPRSMIASFNAAHGIALALSKHSDARLFLITDREDASLDRLARTIARSLDPPRRLRVFPRSLVWSSACFGSVLSALGVRFPLDLVRWRKLTRPLTFSCERAATELAYSPPVSFEEGVQAAVRAAET